MADSGAALLLIHRDPMRRLLTYAAVGACATAVHYALLVLGVEVAGWPPSAATALGAVVGAQVAFFGNRRLTFADGGAALGRSWRRFQLTAMLGAAFSAGAVWAGGRMGWHYLAAQVVATVLALLLTFAINRRWSFR